MVMPTTPAKLPLTATVYLDGPVGVGLSPLTTQIQLGQGITVPVSYNTANMPPGDYQVRLVVASNGKQLFNRVISPLKVKSPALPVTAPAITAPTPTFPTAPTTGMIGVPVLQAPNQVTQGKPWSGNISIPTVIPPGSPPGVSPPTFPFTAWLELHDPGGKVFPIVNVPTRMQIGQPLLFSWGMDTSNLAPGTSNIFLLLTSDSQQLFWKQIGTLQILPAPVVAVPAAAPAPAFPSVPTRAMFGSPIMALPTMNTQGDIWDGYVSIYTVIPPGSPPGVSPPSYPVVVYMELQDPGGVAWTVANQSLNVSLGQTLNIPVHLDMSKGIAPGTSNLMMAIVSGGQQIAWEKIGSTQILASAPPAPVTAAPAPEAAAPAPEAAAPAPAYSYSTEELNTVRANLDTLYYQGQIDYATYSDLYDKWMLAWYGRGPLPNIPATIASMQ